MTRQRGLSFPDLLVAIFLGSVITYVTALFFTGLVRQYFNVNEKLNLSSQAISFREALSRRLLHTTLNALEISADGQRFGFQKFDGIELPENLRWSDRYDVIAFIPTANAIHLWGLTASSLGLSNTTTSHSELPSLQVLEVLSPPRNLSPTHFSWPHATSFKTTLEQNQALRVSLTFELTGSRKNYHKIDFNEVYLLNNDRDL